MTAPAAGRSGLRARARWALAFRLARREARRHPWRHALVVLLVFVPVAATFSAFSGIETVGSVDRSRTTDAVAGADATIDLRRFGYGASQVAEPLAAADPGVHVERMWQGVDWLVPRAGRSDGRLEATQTVGVATRGRLGRRFRVDHGRLPRGEREVLLTAPAAAAGGWKVGDAVSLATWDLPFTVVGIGVSRPDVTDRVAVLSEAVPERYWTRSLGGALPAVPMNGTYLDPNEQVELAAVWVPAGRDPLTVEPVRSAGGYSGTGPSVAIKPATGIGIAVAGAGLAMVTAVVASAAFAIGARRQLRNVGLLATAGADPSVVRAALVLQGALPGALASALALFVGAIGVAVANTTGLAERITGVADARVVLSGPGALVACALGVGAGIVAAWQPARATSRLPLLSALGGRRPLPPLRTRVPLAGFGAMAVGFGLLAVSRRLVDHGPDAAVVVPIAGVICFALGAVGIAPALVAGLGPAAGRVGGIGRLALRGLVRHRSQSAATVAAVSVALALPIGLLTAHPRPEPAVGQIVDATGSHPTVDAVRAGALAVGLSGEESSYAPSPAEAAAIRQAYHQREADVLAALDTPPVRIPTVEVPVPAGTALDGVLGGGLARMAVIDDEDLGDVLVPWAARELARGRILVSAVPSPERLVLGTTAEPVQLSRAAVPDGGLAWTSQIGTDLVASRSTAARISGRRPLDLVSFVRRAPADARERRRLEELAGAPTDRSPTLAEVRRALASSAPTQPVAPEGGVRDPGALQGRVSVDLRLEPAQVLDAWTVTTLLLAAAATVLALAVLTITLTLRSVDGADDVRAAIATGAPPAAVRRLRAVEGAVLTALGAILALPLGWLPVAALRWGVGSNRLFPGHGGPGWFAVPVLVIPVVLAALLWWVVPAARAALAARRSNDLLLPRW